MADARSHPVAPLVHRKIEVRCPLSHELPVAYRLPGESVELTCPRCKSVVKATVSQPDESGHTRVYWAMLKAPEERKAAKG